MSTTASSSQPRRTALNRASTAYTHTRQALHRAGESFTETSESVGQTIANLCKPSNISSRYTYAQERISVKFRLLASIFATPSPYNLTDENLVSQKLQQTLTEWAEFASLPYCPINLTWVFDHREKMIARHYPMEGFNITLGPSVHLVQEIHGKHAGLQAALCYREDKNELVFSPSGTANWRQTWEDLKMTMHRPKKSAFKGAGIHSGFWKMYKGIRTQTISSIHSFFDTHPECTSLVLVGHSMGGALISLLAIDLMTHFNPLPTTVTLRLIALGAPRCGDHVLTHELWPRVLHAFRTSGRTFQEHSIKAFNDGVPVLPPASLGYTHFPRANNYWFLSAGRLYHVPASQTENSLFRVRLPEVQPEDEGQKEEQVEVKFPQWPIGGHNYYHGHDIERMMRRSEFFQELKKVVVGSDEVDNTIFERVHAKYVAWAVEHNNAALALKEKWEA